ncbi:MAG: hypothetical protein BMS9Abin23_1051 [Thermodesulfobacteriota bacterium]|nr:MAG: hypothetical protein BMS9Abin23_1051 [Thermodesulfobacteriota bacterium]
MQRPVKKILVRASDAPDRAIAILRNGGIVAYPTETFYGLGADPFNMDAVKRLFALKGRPPEKPLPLIIKDRPMLSGLVEEVPRPAEILIKRYWPGPLTIIFMAKENVPESITAGSGKVAVRVSSGEACRLLLEGFNSPLTSTSANPSGKAPARSAGEVLEYFNGSIDLLIDGGGLAGELGSTIVDVTGGRPCIVREGAVPTQEILKALNAPG